MQIPVREWKRLSPEQRASLLARSEGQIDDVLEVAREIIYDVRSRGDEAIRHHNHRLDGTPTDLPLAIQPNEFEAAERAIDPAVRDALEYAIGNVRRVHERQVPASITLEEVRPGILAGERSTPIDSAGLYVPRGRGSFPSMLYMLAVPAALAGVPEISIATPPDESGAVDPACLVAAKMCGVSTVYRMGGVQAIAALTYGTSEVAAVAKIVGPGSAYVAAAKRLLRDQVDVGIPAGPSESMIIADETAKPDTVALDLLIEAEHGADSQALLVTSSSELASAVADTITRLVEQTPEPRAGFLREVFAEMGGIILTGSEAESIDVANEFAPEHLKVDTREPWATAAAIRNAGEILIGPHSAFSLANYAAGANAVLPTGGHARTWSGVSVHDFMKRSSVVQVTEPALPEIGRHAQTLAEYEGFYWHARAIRDRG